MADSSKSSTPRPQDGDAGSALSDSDLGSFPPVQANPGSPLDDVAEPYSTHMTRQDLSVPDDAGPADAATSHTLTGDADADAPTSPAPPRRGESLSPGTDGDPGDDETREHLASPPRRAADAAPTSAQAKPAAADADAITLAQLIEARVLEPPDEAARRRNAIALLDKRYELKRKLGEGGMGVVFLAFDRLGDCEVAIKTLRPRFLLDNESRKRFIDEAKQMNRVPSHAHVLVVKGIGTENRPYYVMEHMAGGSLGKLIRKDGPLPRDKAIKLGVDIAKAIEYLHESSGQIHRDIKPENVLLAGDGSAWLCDFGLIRQVGIGAAGLRAGTLAYMPPEVVTDVTKNVAFDWDIYSFGAVLYEMICGKRPYDELFTAKTNPIEQMKLMRDEVTKRPPKPVHEVCRKADPLLAKVSQWCMAREPRERYYRMTDVLADLGRVRQGKHPLGPRQNLATAGGGPSRGARAALALIILLLAAVAWGWFANPFNVRDELLTALGIGQNSSPGVDPVTDKATPPTDGVAKDGTAKDNAVEPIRPIAPNPLVAFQTGQPILDLVNRNPELVLSASTVGDITTYLEGEILSVEVRYSRDCFPIVLLVVLDHPDEPVTVLFPNSAQVSASKALPPPGQTLLVPSVDARQKGMVFRIYPPHGRHLIKVIASNPPLILSDGRSEIANGCQLLDLKTMKVRIANTNGPATDRIEDLLKPEQWSTTELLIMTKEK